MARVTAVILNWRDPKSTIACIKSLLGLQRSLNVVVVDNDSQDGSLEEICDFLSAASHAFGYEFTTDEGIFTDCALERNCICLISSGRNGGYAFGNNRGIELALRVKNCEYIWILNADTVVPEASALSELILYMDNFPEIGICGATILYADLTSRVQTLGGGSIDRRGNVNQLGQGSQIPQNIDSLLIERQLSYVNGACSFVRRSFIEKVGLMSEDYFLYFEELDWSTRGAKYFRLGYCHKAIVWHHVGKSIGTKDDGRRSTLSAYYMNASLLKYCRRYLRSAIIPALLNTFSEVLRHVRRGEWRVATAIFCALIGIGPWLPRRLGLI